MFSLTEFTIAILFIALFLLCQISNFTISLLLHPRLPPAYRFPTSPSLLVIIKSSITPLHTGFSTACFSSKNTSEIVNLTPYFIGDQCNVVAVGIPVPLNAIDHTLTAQNKLTGKLPAFSFLTVTNGQAISLMDLTKIKHAFKSVKL